MSETTQSPYNFTDKLNSLDSAKTEKLQNFGAGVEFEPAVLESLYDVDSPRFVGATGGLGGTDRDGTVFDLTGKLTADRIEGIDSYEVFPDSERTRDYLYNNPRGIRKMDAQRARLAASRGVNVEEITNEDVFEEGAKGTVKTLALLKAYDIGDEDYIEKVKAWEPSSELTRQWRTTSPRFGSAESPLNINVERAASGRFGYYGRPLTSVRGRGSDTLIGVGAGYQYEFDRNQPDRIASDTPTLQFPSEEAFREAYQRQQARRMDFGDRIGNAVDAFQRTLLKEAALDLGDWVGEGLNKVTDGRIGWDLGTDEEKSAIANSIAGFNPYAAEEDYAQAKVFADRIAEGIFDEGKEVNPSDIYELVKIGITTPEMFGDSAGFLASFFVPLLGWGGKAVKVAKNSSNITKAAAHVLSKTKVFAQKNAGLLQVSAGNVNDQIDKYKEEHGASPSVYKVGQMFATESVLLGLDRWADLSILKSPAALKGVRDAFSVMPTEGKTRAVAKVVGVAGGLAVNMGKEAAQEYVQEIGQEFNVQFNFDDNGTFVSVIDEAGDILFSQEMQAKGILGAGLGAGGAVQFAAVGSVIPAAAKSVSLGADFAKKAKESLPAATKPVSSAVDAASFETEVADIKVTEEDKAKTTKVAEDSANIVLDKYSKMLNDEEFTKVFVAETIEEEEALDLPSFKDNLSKNPETYRSSLEEIERTEAILESRKGTDKVQESDALGLKILRKAKRELYKNLMNDPQQPTLGSGYSSEDVVEGYLETVDVKDGRLQLSKTEGDLLVKYAADNGIPALRFTELRKAREGVKTAEDVQEEALGEGERSASTYRTQLRNLVNSPNPSRKAVARVVNNIDNFLITQENRHAALNAALTTAQGNVDGYNTQIEAGKVVPSQVKQQHLNGIDVEGYDNFIAIVEDKATGKLRVHSNSIALVDSVKDNIDHLNRTKARYGKAVDAIISGEQITIADESITEKPKAKEPTKTKPTTAEQEVTIKEVEVDDQLLNNWKDAYTEAKKGKADLNTWLEDNVPAPMAVVKTMLDSAIGKGRPVVHTYYDQKAKDFVPPKKGLDHIPEDTPYQAIDLDPNNYLTVDKTTSLNSLSIDQLRVVAKDNPALMEAIESSIDLFQKTLRAPKGADKGSILDITNSPVAGLVYDTDLNINKNVALASYVALQGFIRNDGYKVRQGKKSKQDVAEMLGIHESQISRGAMNVLSDKGLLYKTAANSIGKDIADLLGLARKSDSTSDAQAYDALIADLGQTALLMGITDGLLERDNSLRASEFATKVLSKDIREVDDGNDAKVIFIQLQKDQEEVLPEIAKKANDLFDALPDATPGRKEPSLTPLSKAQKDKTVSKVHKERLGLEVAEGSQKALRELMDTEWIADLSLMRDILENRDLIKVRLGFIDPEDPAFKNLSFEEQETQEAVNRGIEKSFDEMEWLSNSNEDSSVSLWFNYFFSKNGRFFIDSNTINPQTDKHLHRFTVQPKSHTYKFMRTGGKFLVGKNDVTNKVNYALAQAFGFATDKKDTKAIQTFSKLVFKHFDDPQVVDNAKKTFLSNGKYALDISLLSIKEQEILNGKAEIEIEHLGHALQGFKFLQDMHDAGRGNQFTSSITAEFDAVTSGFGLKNLQMPIIDDLMDGDNWLQKVGVVKDNDPSLSVVDQESMNDLLDSGDVRDSYQTLAANVQFPSDPEAAFRQMLFESQEIKGNVIADNETFRGIWNALYGVLPKVTADGKVDGKLRSLFKYPFMTFNYSASIKSIRKNLLTGELLSGIASQMAAADVTVEGDPIVNLMRAFVGPDGDIKALQDQIRTEPMFKIKSSPGSKDTMEQVLGQMIESSYGAQVEDILTRKFAPFVDAQDKINASFKAMFEIFAVSFEAALEEARKSGPVSKAKEKEIYQKLKTQWPMIKGPLSNMEEEFTTGGGVGIYDTQTSSPYGIHAGRKPVRANLSDILAEELGTESMRVSQMIKQMSAAIAAGSVVPIHYIDGAVMGQAINNLADSGVKGITSIHDAIMPPLLDMDKAQQEYNKQVLDVNVSYSFIDEIMTTLDRFLDDLPSDDSKYRSRMVVDKDGDTIPATDFLYAARNNLATLANDVNSSRERLYRTLNEGAKIMHMAGTAEGVYTVEPNSIEYKTIEPYGVREYNSVEINKQTINDIHKLAKADWCKG